MFGKTGRRKFFGRSPLTLIEIVIAVSTIIGGLYVVSPLIDVPSLFTGQSSPLIHILGTAAPIKVYGLILIVTGCATLIGVWRRNYRLRANAMFINILARLYSLLGTLLVQGFLPFTWSPAATLIAIAVIIYIYLRGLLFRQEWNK
jgi:hypothetical protein